VTIYGDQTDFSNSSAELHLEVVLEVSTGAKELDVGSIRNDQPLRLQLGVILLVDVGETPLLGNDDFLATGELVSGTSEGFNNDGFVVLFASDREDDLANVDTGDSTVRLAPGTSHTSLQSIGTGTAQHFVDTDDMEGVDTDTEMERILSRGLSNVFVSTDTSGFKSLG